MKYNSSNLTIAAIVVVAVVVLTLSGKPSQGQLGTLSGRVSIGPLCPVEPCPGPVPDVYSSRKLVLQPFLGSPVYVNLNSEGTFQASVPAGTYSVDLSDCTFLGCPMSLPQTTTVKPGETTVLQIDIDTGIR